MNDLPYTIYPLFATPFYVSSIELSSEEIFLIKNVEYESRKDYSVDITKSRQILNHIKFSRLKSNIDLHIKNYVTNVLRIKDNIAFPITSSWGVKCTHGKYIDRHFHSNSIFSGVLYFVTDKESGHFKVYNNRDSIFTRTITTNFSEFNYYNSYTWSFVPQQGTLYLFPSFIEHEIVKYNSNVERYSIAFNTFMTGSNEYGNGLSDINLRLETNN